MSDVDDVTAFLREQVAEDERRNPWPWWARGQIRQPRRRARITREITAKRAILAIHEPLPSTYGEPPVCGACWPQPRPGTHPLWPCSTVRNLLAVYSDRPGYDERWRP